MIRSSFLRSSALLLACFPFAPGAPLAAQGSNPPDPDQILRQAVANQIANDQQIPPQRYRFTKIGEHGVFLKDVIDTRDGEVSRLIAINGQPLTADRAAVEQQRLQQLKNDPSLQAHHRKHQQEDQDHIDRLMKELPDAFHFTLIGAEDAPTGPTWHYRFVPNPSFAPPDEESRMFRGMAGEVWIDQNQLHFVRLKAHLTSDIDFGWGLLAVFHKGGSIEMTNSSVGQGHWEITHMKLDVDGTALMLKKLSFHMVENLSDFEPVPAQTGYQQAVSLLQQDPVYAGTSTPFAPAAAANP
jgi:hypothetical protein